MQKTEDSEPRMRACPVCQTWIDDAGGHCHRCGQPTVWLAGAPDLVAALASQAHRLNVLEVMMDDGSHLDPLRQMVSQPLEHIGRDGELWRFSFLGDERQVLVEHRGRTTRLHLPAREETIDGVAISARLLLIADVPGPPPRIEEFLAGNIALGFGGKTTLGSGTHAESSHVSVPDRTLALRHCLIVPGQARDLWIADLGTPTGTFVNGQPIVSVQLREGDDLQLGTFAWRFDESNHFLVPLKPIKGAEVQARQIAVSPILDPLDLIVPAGQFVAIVGPSGAGKSTLLKVLLAGPGTRHQGTVAIGGFDADAQTEQFRSELGYVSQEAALHRDLPVLDAVRFSTLVRGKKVDPQDIKILLRQLDVDPEHWEQSLGSLSGGELKRVRVVAEFAGRPRCLLLDEPASGLDAQREQQLMRWLRRLSNQGCTVLIVTHNLEQLDWVDRVVVLRDRRIAFDSTPVRFRSYCPGPHYDLKQAPFPATEIDDSISNGNATGTSRQRKRRRLAGRVNRGLLEARHLIEREAVRLLRSWPARLLVPLLVLPLVFATLLDCSVQPFDRELLGFLAVVSCIWMGGSLSLTTIVDEREVIDYERLLFLHFGPYIAAKTVVCWTMAFFQTACFLTILQTLRLMRRDDAGLLGAIPWCLFCFWLVACAAIGVGLVLSAVAKWAGSKELAHFLLPLVMMGQMVLSVQVFKPDADGGGPLAKYHNFSWQHSRDGRLSLAAAGSYLTLSRYGDVALMAFAYRDQDFAKFARERVCFRSSAAILLAVTAALPLIAGLILLIGERFPVVVVGRMWRTARQSTRIFMSEFSRGGNLHHARTNSP